jgi:ATP-binding cassette subfamily F protein uup
MAPPLIQLKDIALTFGGTPLLTGAGPVGFAGERVCLVGRNGSGKSTLLKIAAGLVEPDSRHALRSARRDGALPAAGAGFRPASRRRWPMSRAGSAPATIRIPRAILLEEPRPHRRGKYRRAVRRRGARAALARVLAPSPDMLLLDEPTNHLDLPTIEWLEGELSQPPLGLV